MPTSDSSIIVEDLRKSFKKLVVLDGISFKVKRGTVLALLGPNGAGKTTIIKILSTLLNSNDGRAVIEGFDVEKDVDNVRSLIGLTGQFTAIDDYLTGEENLYMIGRLYHLNKADTKHRTAELLQQLDLVDAAKRKVKTYSGGMRRRLDLAASLIASPPIIFLDEPTTGLDPRSRLVIWEMIEKLVSSCTTILLTTQYMDEADQLAHNIVVIDGGKVIAQGTPNELKRRVGSERLEIVVLKPGHLKAAQKAIGAKDAYVDEKRRTITVTTKNGARDLSTALAKLNKVRVEVESVSLHHPTLDDVFLTFTGHTSQSDEQKEPSNNKRGKQHG